MILILFTISVSASPLRDRCTLSIAFSFYLTCSFIPLGSIVYSFNIVVNSGQKKKHSLSRVCIYSTNRLLSPYTYIGHSHKQYLLHIGVRSFYRHSFRTFVFVLIHYPYITALISITKNERTLTQKRHHQPYK